MNNLEEEFLDYLGFELWVNTENFEKYKIFLGHNDEK